jgi:hypothetical protein
MPWVDKLGFSRWAWSKGLLQPRNGWQAWEVLDPYACHIMERPVPNLCPAGGDEYSMSYLERVMKKEKENKGGEHE